MLLNSRAILPAVSERFQCSLQCLHDRTVPAASAPVVSSWSHYVLAVASGIKIQFIRNRMAVFLSSSAFKLGVGGGSVRNYI